MTFRHYVPSPPLSRFVDVFWSASGYAPEHALEQVLPTGTTELVINLKDDAFCLGAAAAGGSGARGFQGAVVVGVHTEPFVLGTAEQGDVIGVHFRSGGAFPFFQPPAAALHGTHVALGDLWGDRAAELRQRLLEAAPEGRFRLLEQFLLAQLARPLRRDPAVAFALARFALVPQPCGIAETAAEAGLSQRRFIELFRREVGVTPKVYCRIQRFQHAISGIQGGIAVDWADLAQSCGYYDQAHLIGEFKAFAGHAPTAYQARVGANRNHLPIRE